MQNNVEGRYGIAFSIDGQYIITIEDNFLPVSLNKGYLRLICSRSHVQAHEKIHHHGKYHYFCMKCWRDLGKECAEKDCPMWMEGLDIDNFDANENLGLNGSRCALVFREKMEVLQQMFDLMDTIEDLPSLLDEELLEMMTREKEKPARPKLPAGRPKKGPQSSSRGKTTGTGKQLPIG